jgi:hypothetical protein
MITLTFAAPSFLFAMIRSTKTHFPEIYAHVELFQRGCAVRATFHVVHMDDLSLTSTRPANMVQLVPRILFFLLSVMPCVHVSA